MSTFFQIAPLSSGIKYDWSVIQLYYVTFDSNVNNISVDMKYNIRPLLDHYQQLENGKTSFLLVDVVIPGISLNNENMSVQKLFTKLNLAKEVQNLPVEFQLMKYMFLRFLSLIYLSDAIAIQGDVPLFSRKQLQEFKLSTEDSDELLVNLFNNGFSSIYINNDDKLFQWDNFMRFNISIYTPQTDVFTQQELDFINTYNNYILKMLLMYKQDPDMFNVPLRSLLDRVVTHRRRYLELKYDHFFIDDVKVKLTDESSVVFSVDELVLKMNNICSNLVLRPLHIDVIQNRFDHVKCVKAKSWDSTHFGYYCPVINGIYPNMWKLYKVATVAQYNELPLIKTKIEVVSWNGGDVNKVSNYPYYVILIHNIKPDLSSEFTAIPYFRYLNNMSSFTNKICLSNHKELHSSLNLHRLSADVIDSEYMPIGYNWMIKIEDNKPKIYIWHRRHFDTNHAYIERLYQYQNTNSFHDQWNVFEMHRLFSNIPLNIVSYFDYGKTNQLGCRMFSVVTFADLTFQNLTKDTFVSRTKNVTNVNWYFEMTGQRVMLPGKIADETIQTVYSGTIQICHSNQYDSNNVPFILLDSENINYVSTFRNNVQVKPYNWCRLAIKYPEANRTTFTYFQQYTSRRSSDPFAYTDFGLINGRYAITSKTITFDPAELYLHQELQLNSINVPLVIFTHDLKRFPKIENAPNLNNLKETAKYYHADVTFSGGRKLSFGELNLDQMNRYSVELYKNNTAITLPPEFYHPQFYYTIEELNQIIDNRFFPVGGTFLTFLMNCGLLMQKREFKFQMNATVDSVQRIKPFYNEVSDAFMYLNLRDDFKNVTQFFNSLNVWLYRHFQFWVYLLPIPDNDDSDKLYHVINYQAYVDKINTIQKHSGAIKPTYHRYYLVFMPYGETSITKGRFIYSFTFSKNKSINRTNNIYAGDLSEYLAISEHVSNPGLFHVTHESRLNSFDYVNGNLRRIYFDEMNRIATNSQPKPQTNDVLFNIYSLDNCLKLPYAEFQKIMFDVQGGIAKFKANTSKKLDYVLTEVFDENKLYPYQFVIYLMLSSTNNAAVKNPVYPKLLELVRNSNSQLNSNKELLFLENYFLVLVDQPHMTFSECIQTAKPLIEKISNQLDNYDETLLLLKKELDGLLTVEILNVERPLFHYAYPFLSKMDLFVRSSKDSLRYTGFIKTLESELINIKSGLLGPFVRYFDLQLNDKITKTFKPSPIDRAYFKLDRQILTLTKTVRGKSNNVNVMDDQLTYIQETQTSLDDINNVLMLIALDRLNTAPFNLNFMRECPLLYYHYLSIFISFKEYTRVFVSEHFAFVFEIVYILKKCTSELQSFARVLIALLAEKNIQLDMQNKCRLLIISIMSLLDSNMIYSNVFNTLRKEVLNLPYEVYDERGIIVYNRVVSILKSLKASNQLKLADLKISQNKVIVEQFLKMYINIKFAVNPTYVPTKYKNDSPNYDYTADKTAMKNEIEQTISSNVSKTLDLEVFLQYKWWSFIKMQLIVCLQSKEEFTGAFKKEIEFFNKPFTAENDPNKFQDVPKNIIDFIDKDLLKMGSKFSDNSLAASGKAKPLSSYHCVREVLNFITFANLKGA